MSVTAGVRLDLTAELARELARVDGELWERLEVHRRDRYRDLADCALNWDSWNLRPVPSYRAPTPVVGLTVAQVEAAVRKIVGAKPLGKWLLHQLRDELVRETPAA